MKFGFSVFIGIFLVLLGISIFLEQFLRIDFPLGKFFLAGCFIYIGYQLVKNRLSMQHNIATGGSSPMEFGEHNVKPSANSSNRTFKYIFSSGVVDLRELPTKTSEGVQVVAIFSDVKVWLRKNQKVHLESKSVFGSLTQPNRQSTHFGNDVNEIAGAGDAVRVDCQSIFSAVAFEYPEDFAQPPQALKDTEKKAEPKVDAV